MEMVLVLIGTLPQLDRQLKTLWLLPNPYISMDILVSAELQYRHPFSKKETSTSATQVVFSRL